MRQNKQNQKVILAAAVVGVGLTAGIAPVYGANGTWQGGATEIVGPPVVSADSWANPGNWVGATIPGDNNGASSTTGDYAYINTVGGLDNPNITVDANRAVNRLYVGGGYTVGSSDGNAIWITNIGYIWGNGPSGIATIGAPLNFIGSGTIQTDTTKPLVFDGAINIATATNITVLNTAGTVTFNGSLSGAGKIHSNGGNVHTIILNAANTNAQGISLDVSRGTVVMNHAGAVSFGSANAGRGGNFELNAENAMTGSGGISATAIYLGTLSPTNAIYGSIVRINADNNYTGNTSINGAAVALDRIGLDPEITAALWVNNGHDSTGSATGAGDVTVSGALLAGDGRIVNTGSGKGITISNRTTNIGNDPDGAGPLAAPTGVAQGRLSPGASEGAVGTLTLSLGVKGLNISDAVTPTNTGALLFDLVSPANSDKVVLTAGVLNIGSGLEFDDFVYGLPNITLEDGEYTLFDTNALITGSLGTNLGGTIGGKTATLSFGDGGQDIILTVVPEPSALAGLGLAWLGFAARRRRALC